MKLIELKIKRLELAHEVKLNRHEQRLAIARARSAAKTNYDRQPHDWQYHLLRTHQQQVVSPAARAAGLAASYLRGQLFSVVETKPKAPRQKEVTRFMIDAVVLNLLNFGQVDGRPDARFRDVEDWVSGKLTHLQLIDVAERDAAQKELELAANEVMTLHMPDQVREPVS